MGFVFPWTPNPPIGLPLRTFPRREQICSVQFISHGAIWRELCGWLDFKMVPNNEGFAELYYLLGLICRRELESQPGALPPHDAGTWLRASNENKWFIMIIVDHKSVIYVFTKPKRHYQCILQVSLGLLIINEVMNLNITNAFISWQSTQIIRSDIMWNLIVDESLRSLLNISQKNLLWLSPAKIASSI